MNELATKKRLKILEGLDDESFHDLASGLGLEDAWLLFYMKKREWKNLETRNKKYFLEISIEIFESI